MALKHEDLTDAIIAAAIEVHRHLGPGLLESAYETCLRRELDLRDVKYFCQLHIPLEYKGLALDCGYRIDVLVADTIIVEIKAIEKILPVHEAQLLTYMKLLQKPVGLLLNFNAEVLKNGIVRRVL